MDLLTFENLITLGLLTLLQGVLGLDNLLYISLESKNAPIEKQKMVRNVGIGVAIFLRIVLLFLLMRVIEYFQDPIFGFDFTGILEGHFNIHSLIVLAGGVFIIYTSIKEIWHMMALETDIEGERKPKSVAMITVSIVIMNIVFSFDSILSAMALSDVFAVMAIAIIIGGLMMIWLAGTVSEFLKKNRMYEVLGLFILFVVGIMLCTEGGHLAHLRLFGDEIVPMSKTTFYFIIGILVLIDIVQGKYQKNLIRLREKNTVVK